MKKYLILLCIIIMNSLNVYAEDITFKYKFTNISIFNNDTLSINTSFNSNIDINFDKNTIYTSLKSIGELTIINKKVIKRETKIILKCINSNGEVYNLILGENTLDINKDNEFIYLYNK